MRLIPLVFFVALAVSMTLVDSRRSSSSVTRIGGSGKKQSNRHVQSAYTHVASMADRVLEGDESPVESPAGAPFAEEGEGGESSPVEAPAGEEDEFPPDDEEPPADETEGTDVGNDVGGGEDEFPTGEDGSGSGEDETPPEGSGSGEDEIPTVENGTGPGEDETPTGSGAGEDEVPTGGEGSGSGSGSGSGEDEIPSSGSGEGTGSGEDETPSSGSGLGEDEFPTGGEGSGSGEDETPSSGSGSGSGEDESPPVQAPTFGGNSPTNEFPTAGSGSGFSQPTPFPTFPIPAPTPTLPQTPEPTSKYVSTDDDPIKDMEQETDDNFAKTDDGWGWNESTVEELEHDKTVVIALSVTFGAMFLFSIFVAHQMLHNPQGCCASICRITVACLCGILKCFCYPCRALCGCTGGSARRPDHMIVPEDGHFTHDLELS
eukprot:CAMPEP_0113463990 /NCGR_PEP_ID=MMETSP0014_2-20120614/12957_1 /TAXON_ID=2857 /ORGANISM="Nitzschia sp." /LENGTH=430 /DNA_ID=CAMNT_0000356031 /DNA_START=102 /DNA_END=1394 /DNA_ORIENTATION=+ /assembly_acc=CAM_ASM_000159